MTDELEPAALTDEQRAAIAAFYADHPDGGYKSACRAAGIHATKDEARRIIQGDDDLADIPFRALRVDEGSALKAIGEILSDPEHKDRLRAATWVASALHGHREKTETTVNGQLEVDTPELAAAVERFTALADAAVRAAARTRTRSALADAAAGGEGAAGVRLGQLDRPGGSAAA